MAPRPKEEFLTRLIMPERIDPFPFSGTAAETVVQLAKAIESFPRTRITFQGRGDFSRPPGRLKSPLPEIFMLRGARPGLGFKGLIKDQGVGNCYLV